MVDDGYLVGFEDSNGNFVEVGRFNNTSENVSDPLIIQHSDSGQQMELGPNGFSTESVSTGALAVGGTLFEEDRNSPIDVTSQSSATYNVSGSYRNIIIIPDNSGVGFDELQVNGDTGSNYDILDNGDTQTNGLTEWQSLPRDSRATYYELRSAGSNKIMLSVGFGGAQTGNTIGGVNENVSGDITQFTFKDGADSSRDFRARVYGRVI